MQKVKKDTINIQVKENEDTKKIQPSCLKRIEVHNQVVLIAKIQLLPQSCTGYPHAVIGQEQYFGDVFGGKVQSQKITKLYLSRGQIRMFFSERLEKPRVRLFDPLFNLTPGAIFEVRIQIAYRFVDQCIQAIGAILMHRFDLLQYVVIFLAELCIMNIL